jgi:hypothetical protein
MSRGKKSTPAGRGAFMVGVLIGFYGFCHLFGAFLVLSGLGRLSPVHIYPAIVVESVIVVPLCAFGSYKLIRFWRRGLRYSDDQCAKCGYLLNGNTSEFCPECGRPTGPRQRPWHMNRR